MCPPKTVRGCVYFGGDKNGNDCVWEEGDCNIKLTPCRVCGHLDTLKNDHNTTFPARSRTYCLTNTNTCTKTFSL